jgi:RimJ/RimL family protein N-acetyltransferase
MNKVMKFDKFALVMFDENVVQQLTECTQNIKNIGPNFTLKLKPIEYWLNKLKQGQIWTDKNGYLALVDDKNKVFGVIWHFSHGIEASFEIGINIVLPEYRNGQGYGTLALDAYCKYLFDTYPINRLQYNMIEDNIPSEKLAIKTGFSFEGIQRKSLFILGEWRDVKLYSKLRGES